MDVDTVNTIHRRELRRLAPGPLLAPAAVVCAWVFGVLFSGDAAEAQGVRLNATGGRVQQIAHNGQSAPQVFPEVKWIVVNSQGQDGAIVDLSCVVFSSVLDSRSKVDVQLDLRVLKTPGGADWRVDKPTDVSDVSGGNGAADVGASSTERGNAQFGIVVTFVNYDVSSLLQGDYETTLVGTITSN